MFQVPRTTPKCALIYETKGMKNEHKITQRKLEYYIELNNRNEESIESTMKTFCVENEREYLKEIQQLKEKHNINEKIEEMVANEAISVVKEKVCQKNNDEILQEMRNGSKTKDAIEQDVLEDYMESLSFENAKTIFLC